MQKRREFAGMLGMTWPGLFDQYPIFVDGLTGSIQGMGRLEALPVGCSLVVDQDIGLG